jgi:hypothetical protein
MPRFVVLLVALTSLACGPVVAASKNFAANDFVMPVDKAVTIVLLRPDVEVGEVQAGGLTEPNADWTASARGTIQNAVDVKLKSAQAQMQVLDQQTGDAAQLVGDYQALHQAVASAIMMHKVLGVKLPTKKDRFDWTMGPGTQPLGELSSSNYGLFLFVRDGFASASRRGVQAVGMLGCLVGVCIITTGSQHVYYASLVELSTGNVVWFNFLRGSKGDVREPAGAATMIDALLATMPTQASSTGKKTAPAKSAGG